MRTHYVVVACSFVAAFALAACGSGQPSNPSSDGNGQSSASTAVPQEGHFHAELVLDGQPALAADGKNIVVAVKVTNDGPRTFGSDTEPNQVNLGAHAIDGAGNIIINDLARGHLPQIAPGATEKASIMLPADQTLGHSVALLPVQENVGWFSVWGTKPLAVGPFQGCKDASISKVCNASGVPLSATSAQ